MRIFFRWIRKQSYLLLAIFLFGLSVNQVMRFHLYQHSIYVQSSIGFYRNMDRWKADVDYYFGLKEENDRLARENQRLRSQLSTYALSPDSMELVNHFDSVHQKPLRYAYIQAKVIRSNTRLRNNTLILDKGSLDGIKPNMGVIAPEGIVGIVLQTSEHYALVMSILNSKFELTPYFQELQLQQGVLAWDGQNSRQVTISEVNKAERIRKGMHVQTSHYSTLFPPGLPIGRVSRISESPDNTYVELGVTLGVNFQRLQHVTVVQHLFADEEATLMQHHQELQGND
ncbi:MAG: rod shape-determining protein MreC [Bacteroidota bacterium]